MNGSIPSVISPSFFMRIHQKKSITGTAVLLIVLSLPFATFAAPYSDVPTGSWYESVVQKFKDKGYLYRVHSTFNPSHNAIRADFIQLILDAQGGIAVASPRVPSFTDVESSAWFYAYMEEAGRLKWVKGDGNCYGHTPCYARPMGNINRAEAAALLVRAFGFEQTGAAKHFTDNAMGQWYTDPIQIAADHCILQGDDATGLVRPSDLMNRAEMVAMIDRAQQRLNNGVDCGPIQNPAPKISSITAYSDHSVVVDFTVDVDPTSVVKKSLYTITNSSDVVVTDVKIIRGNGVELTFNKALISGKMYTLAVQKLLTKDKKSFADSVSFIGFTKIADSKSTLTVAAVQVSNAKQSLPRGALHVPVLSVDFTASCDAPYTLEGVTIAREGQGSKEDFEGVYAIANGERITRMRTIDAKNNTASLHFTRPVVIPACGTRRIAFVADVKDTASISGEHRFAIRSVLDIESNAQSIQASFPVKGSLYSIAAVTTGTINAEYRSVSPSEVSVGDKNATIGKIYLTANNTENHNIQSILFKQQGSLKPGDIQNIHMQRSNGETVTGILKSTSSDYMLFTFNPPFLLKQGDNVTLGVVADIVGGAGRTIQLTLEEPSDVYAFGTVNGKSGTFGSRVSVSNKINPAFLSIDAGGFIVEVDGPSQQNYSSDQRDAVLANVLLTSGDEAVNVRSMYVLVQFQTSIGTGLGTGAAADDEINEVIKNVKLRSTTKGRSVSGVRLTGANDAVSSAQKTYQIYRFDEFNIRGKENWQFAVDFVNNGQGKHPVSGDKFRIYICGEPKYIRNSDGTAAIANTSGCDFGGVLSSKSTAYQMNVEGLSTGDRITDVRPRGSIAGNFHSIATAALTIAQQATLSTDTTTKNAKNISLLRFDARAGVTKGVLLTRVVFEALSGNIQNGQSYQLWVDTNDDSIVDTLLQTGVSPQGSTLTFNKIANGGYLISQNQSRTFEVRSNITSSPTSNTLQLKFATSIGTYIDAEKVDGSTLGGIRTNGSCVGSCDISVVTDTATQWTIVSQGNLFVNKSSTSVRAVQILAGTLSDTLLRLSIRADNEAVDLTGIQITSSGSLASSIERLELFLDGATQPFALATTSGCGNSSVITTHQNQAVTTFCASLKSQQLVINASQSIGILVKARIKADTSGAISGQPLQLWIAGQTSNGVQSISARGMASSTDLIANNGDNIGQGEVIIGRNAFASNMDIVGEKNVVVLAKISSIKNVNPDANGSAIPTGVSDIAQFAIGAPINTNTKNGTNHVVMEKMLFTLNASNVALDADSMRLARRENSSVEHVCTVSDSNGNVLSGVVNGSLRIFCENLSTSRVSTEIGSGETAVFVIRANMINPTIAGKSSTLQVSLQSIIDADVHTFGLEGSHIQWIDKDGATSQHYFWVDQSEASVTSTSYKN